MKDLGFDDALRRADQLARVHAHMVSMHDVLMNSQYPKEDPQVILLARKHSFKQLTEVGDLFMQQVSRLINEE